VPIGDLGQGAQGLDAGQPRTVEAQSGQVRQGLELMKTVRRDRHIIERTRTARPVSPYQSAVLIGVAVRVLSAQR
jgi:hypothetical protein